MATTFPTERFRAPLKERRGFKWVSEMFRRHRKPAKQQASLARSDLH